MRNRTPGALLVVVFFLTAAARGPQSSPGHAGAVRTQMHNVVYHFTANIVVHIEDLAGELVPTATAPLPIFDDKNSFVLTITAAEIEIGEQSLANALNSFVFSAKDAPLKEVSIRIENDRLKIRGKLHDKGDIEFESVGHLSVTGDGKVRLHAEKIRAFDLPVKGLMDLLGVKVADLIKTGKAHGVSAEKDDLIIDANEILPPPHIEGRLTAVRLRGHSIVEVFGDPGKHPWVHIPARNYMAYRGNRLRFGKLTMDDTDMVLIDMDPNDPFDFFLDGYIDQLVAGYTKNTRDNGLRVFMRDYNKLKPATPR